MVQEFVTYCPRCGEKDVIGDEPVCRLCGIERVPTDMTIAKHRSMTTQDQSDWGYRLLKKVIKKNPLFDRKARKESIRTGMEWLLVKYGADPNKPKMILPDTIRCPSCHSTNFQMVNRKWSLMTGFMTNKVDRVCTNCKKRF